MAQRIFFVATAPSDPDGHVNVSPKGLSDSFAVLEPAPGGLLRVRRLGHRDHRAPARQRPHRADVLRVRRAAQDLSGCTGTGEAVLAEDPRAAELIERFPAPPHAGPAQHHRDRRHPGLRLLRLRRAADVVRGRPRPAGPVLGAQDAASSAADYRATRNAAQHRRRPGLRRALESQGMNGRAHADPRQALPVAGGARPHPPPEYVGEARRKRWHGPHTQTPRPSRRCGSRAGSPRRRCSSPASTASPASPPTRSTGWCTSSSATTAPTRRRWATRASRSPAAPASTRSSATASPTRR